MLAKLFSNTKPMLTGIDIGSYAVKAVTLQQDGEDCTLTAMSYEPLPANVIAEREVQDIESLAKTLNKIKTHHQSQRVASAISGNAVFSKVIQMDANLTEQDLEQQIEIEADSLIPYPLSEVYLDFEVLGSTATNHKKVDVLISAARRQSVISRAEAIDSQGMQTDIMDIESYALGRAGHYLLADQLGDGMACCIDIGVNQMLMAVINKQEVIFASDQAFGTQQLFQALARSQGIELNQAEQQFKQGDLPDSFVQQILLPFQINLAQQMQRIMQMYQATTTTPGFDTLLLSGSVMQLPQISEYLESSFSEPIAIAEPFNGLTISETVDQQLITEYQQQMMIAFGLALRGNSKCHT